MAAKGTGRNDDMQPNPAPGRLAALRAAKHERRSEFLAAVREFTRPMLNDDGSWAIELTSESGRLDLQLACAFYGGDAHDIALANRLTRRAPIGRVNGKRFDIFNTSIACNHLVVFEDRLEPETRAWCEGVLEEGCCLYEGMSSPQLQFQGWNDNMPAMAAKTLVLGGERLNQPAWTAIGRHNVHGFAKQLSCWGLISEYNSPNYTPDTIHNLTTLALHTRDTRVRRLASDIVKRVWMDLAAHWHPTAHCPAGPFSRAYAIDFNNYTSSLNCLLWFLFGPELSPVSALEAIAPRPGIEPMHGNDPLEHAARMSWYAILDDGLLDDDTASLFVEKPTPYACIASALQGDWTGDWGDSPLRKTTATTYIEADYSLGSAAFAFCGGEQTASLYATGRGDAISPVLYSRYLVDDAEPGLDQPNDWHRLTIGEANFSSKATAITVQHQQTALASYVPHRELEDGTVSRLSLALIAPRAVGQFGGFFAADGTPLEVDRSYPAHAWYGARLGHAIAAFRPLAYAAGDLPEPVLIPRRNRRYDFLEIINYKGPVRRFARSDLACILNGGVMEVAAAADWDSIASLLQALEAASRFEDYLLFRTRRIQYQRDTLPDRERVMLGLQYSPAFDGCAERVVNGRLAPEPVWTCTNQDRHVLPFLDTAPVTSLLELPWPDLFVHRFPDIPWAQGEAARPLHTERLIEPHTK